MNVVSVSGTEIKLIYISRSLNSKCGFVQTPFCQCDHPGKIDKKKVLATELFTCYRKGYKFVFFSLFIMSLECECQ